MCSKFQMGKRKPAPPSEQLLDEVRSIEVLLDEVAGDLSEMEMYWMISMDLIGLVSRIEDLATLPDIAPSDPRFVALRSDLSRLESRIMQLSAASEV
jgi:hypothetical protein